MTFKTILVFVDSGKSAGNTLGVARELAARFGGHIVGLHVRPRFQSPAFTEGTFAMDSVYRAHDENVRADEAVAAAAFKAALGGGGASSEWRVVDGFPADELATAARYADLVVTGQVDPTGSPGTTPADLAEHVALSTERAVLVVPHVGAAKQPGKVVLLCWNGSREAARAATAALPLLAKADKVIVLTVDAKDRERGHGAESDAQVAEWLARHDVKVTVQRDVAVDSDVGNLILSRAADYDADLVVMGVYGHSRLREFVLGGVSRTLLASMTVPLLIAH